MVYTATYDRDGLIGDQDSTNWFQLPMHRNGSYNERDQTSFEKRGCMNINRNAG